MPALAGAEPGRRRWPGGSPGAAQTTIGSSALATTCTSGAGQRVAPQLRHHGDLLGPVELVAAEVEQRHHARLGRLQHLGEVVLVHLQHRVRRAAGLGQRRGVPGGHVGAEGVGGDRPEHADRGGGQPGGGGLAVGAGDQRDRRARPARWASRSGSIFRPIQPPITEPSPRPAARDSAAAVRDTELATLARRGIFASVTRARLPDRRAPPDRRRRSNRSAVVARRGRPGSDAPPDGVDLCRKADRRRRAAAALHSAPPLVTCGFARGSGAPRGRILVAGGGKWSRVGRNGEAGRAHRPGGSAAPRTPLKGEGVGPMFLGTHTPRLDDKGRLILPAKFRDELAGGVVITKGQERCLYVFPTPEFQRIAEQLRAAADDAQGGPGLQPGLLRQRARRGSRQAGPGDHPGPPAGVRRRWTASWW